MTKRGNGEGTFYKRDSGWLCRVRVGAQRVNGSGRTKTEAKAAAMERARLVADKPAVGTVRTLVEEWSKAEPRSVGLRATTHDNYRYLLGTRVVPVLGDVRLANLTKRQVAELVRGWDASASTKRSAYAALVKVLDYAVEAGILAVNPAREVPRPPAPQPAQEHRGTDSEGARRILSAAEGHRWQVAAWLAFGCGLRRGEVLGLRWADVDLDRAELTVRAGVTRSSAGLLRGQPKTRRGVRMVPMPAAVIEQLKAHRTRQTAERLAAIYWTDQDLVVTNEVGGLVEPRSLSRAWNGWARKAKVKDRGTHVGRHYAASTLLASGAASVADVAAAMGHDPAVLLNTYAVAVAKGQRAASDALGGTLIVPTIVPTASQN